MISQNTDGYNKDFVGLSTDDKSTIASPSEAFNGATFFEMDTGKVYFYDATGNQWIEPNN